MDTVKVDVKSADQASRIELFIRWVWMVITYIVIFFLGIVAYVCFILQWLLILLTGKRNATLTTWLRKYWVYQTQFMAYWLLLTDERNPIMPE
jgi:hypothetical protein